MSRGIRHRRTSEDVCPLSSNLSSHYTCQNTQCFLIADLCPRRDLISIALCGHDSVVVTDCVFTQLAMMLPPCEREIGRDIVTLRKPYSYSQVTLSSYSKPLLIHPPHHPKSAYLFFSCVHKFTFCPFPLPFSFPHTSLIIIIVHSRKKNSTNKP